MRATTDDLDPTRTYNAPSVVVHPDNPRLAYAATQDVRARTCHLLRSEDGGQTWSLLAASPSPADYPLCFHNTGMVTQTPLTIGPDGPLYSALSGYDQREGEGPSGNMSIFLARSTDGGTTFEAPVLINDDPHEQLYGQFNPNVDVAPSGRVDVVWWDFRDSPALYANDVYYAYSTDNGQSWSDNLRITDRSVNRILGPWSGGFDVRAPAGLASRDEMAVIGWDDTREGDAEGQAQDIYAAAAQFEPLPAPGAPVAPTWSGLWQGWRRQA